MRSNYNDIIDVILTLIEDEDIQKNIAIAGSIVPYIISKKDSNEFHSDFYVLVKEKKINSIRRKMKRLSNEYEFDFVSDSIKYGNGDYGLKVKYENTAIGFFPYSLINNNLCIKTYAKMKDEGKIKLKRKLIPDVSKSSVIRLIPFNDDSTLRIMSPEFVLAEIETREKDYEYTTKETYRLLDKMVDESVLKKVRDSVKRTRISVETKGLTNMNLILTIILALVFIALILVAVLVVKK